MAPIIHMAWSGAVEHRLHDGISGHNHPSCYHTELTATHTKYSTIIENRSSSTDRGVGVGCHEKSTLLAEQESTRAS